MKLNFAKKKMTFAKLECETVLKLSLAMAEMNFCSCQIDSLFGKVELHVGDFPFCSGGIDIHFGGEIQMGKVHTCIVKRRRCCLNRRERNGDRAGGLDSNSSAVQHEPRWLPSGQPQRLAQGPRQRQQRRLEPQLPQPGQGRFQGIAASRIIYCLFRIESSTETLPSFLRSNYLTSNLALFCHRNHHHEVF